MFLLDTNVISELRKPQADPAVRAWILRRRPHDLYLSVVTVMEIELGIRRLERKDEIQGRRLRTWLEDEVLDLFSGRILAVDIKVAARAAALQVPDPRPERDCLLAATALVHDMEVVTRNVKDFLPMTSRVINPWET
ncbi:MAG TPA: type II toxin-antitoxin system VapC family toxin [Brevibacterium sp.]|nr:type II toxin-antitoxin system VapC family toxin [Brevibacterium sp.]